MKNQKGFVNLFSIMIIIALAGAMGYFIFVKQSCRLKNSPDLYVCGNYLSNLIDLARKPVSVNPTPKNEPVSIYHPVNISHDVKYFYDTIQYPKSGEPIGTSHKERVSIRGKLTATEIHPECSIAPCPQPNPPDYQYALEDISGSAYYIYILRTPNASFIKTLKIGKMYKMIGTLEHSFNYMKQPNFTFDAEAIAE